MIKILLSGFDGAMGQVVSQMVSRTKDIKVAEFNDSDAGDVVLDFSHASTLESVLKVAVKTKMPLVIATTGHSKAQEQLIAKVAEEIPILKSTNFSLAVYKFTRAVAMFAKAWDGDIEIIETHHNMKVDAPSGTAITIANAIIDARGGVGRVILGRTSDSAKRESGDVGISAVRGGVLTGMHEVRFYDATSEVVMYEREYSKDVFAEGALRAVKFISQIKKPGLYTMADLCGD